MEHLKALIAKNAAKIPGVTRFVAASYQGVLETLRKQKEPWISYEEFLRLCQKQNLDLEKAKYYAGIFNELGHLIHYNTDSLLKNTLILKPEWLSKAISFILEDKKVKENNGLVSYERLSELWNNPKRKKKEQYPQNLYPVFLKLMERFDLSYEVELPEKTYLIAQLVPTIAPNYSNDWVKKLGELEETHVVRILDAETGRTTKVEGLMYRLIVRLHRFSLGKKDYHRSRHWKNGLLLGGKHNGHAFMENIDGDIYVTVRAPYPSNFLGYLCGEVKFLVQYFWKGLDPRLHLICPTNNCKGLLERDEIVSSKKEGNLKIRCSVCRKFYQIDSLMSPFPSKPEDISKELEVIDQKLEESKEKIIQSIESHSVEVQTFMSKVDEQYNFLITTLTEPAKDSPRLFSFEPVNRSKFNPKTWTKETFRLTLWCEHSRLPLPLINGDTSDVYEIELTLKWFQRAAPILKIISNTLKLALPLAIPDTKLTTDDSQYNAIAEQLEFGTKFANFLLQGSEKMGEYFLPGEETYFHPTNTRNILNAQGSQLRELHALLSKKDPARNFGGLEQVQNKRG
ncbi:MAG: hypothetical protein GDA44_11675 [Prochloron sp. SP5CPC1]|nr:hypothetical protein [Candidatus Paraprochloron terpiosi SP5CPC1]